MMAPAETARRNADPDPNREAPFCCCDDLSRVAWFSQTFLLPPGHVQSLGPAARPGYGRSMCGRVRLSSDVSEIKLVFSIPPHRPTPNFPPSWNAAPTDSLPVVRSDQKAGERSPDLLRWGLVPFWAKDLNVGFANINAKAEGIETRPAFREAFQRRRCLVPVDSFYEWKKTAICKQPYAIALADRSLMALAGLWENWRSPVGEWVRSFAIVTTTSNELCGELHNRMPVVLKPETWPVWLGEEPADASSLKALLAPLPSDEMTCWPVSARVGNVKNNDPSLIERIAA
jgi:putative SOS response-associated peptidase YedK